MHIVHIARDLDLQQSPNMSGANSRSYPPFGRNNDQAA